MRVNCPNCGLRDSREFHYRGSAKLAERPDPEAGEEAFFDYVFLRDNPPGANAELWYHQQGCRAWIVAERNVTTHEFLSARLADDATQGGRE